MIDQVFIRKFLALEVSALSILCFRLFLVAFLIPGSHLHAQLPDPLALSQVPVPEVGHDLIGMGGETVNPATGEVSFELPITTPAGRQLNFPFAIRFDDSSTYYVAGQPQTTNALTPGQLYYATNRDSKSTAPPFELYGWSFDLPYYQATSNVTSSFGNPSGCGNPAGNPCPGHNTNFCWGSSGYSFHSLDGRTYALGLNNSWPDPGNSDLGQTTQCGQWGQAIGSGGDRNIQVKVAALSSAWGPGVQGTMTLTERDGKVYQFPQVIENNNPSVQTSNSFGSLAQSVTDRNGNQITYNGTPPQAMSPNVPGSYIDTLGRSIVSWSGLGSSSGDQISIAGLGTNVVVRWQTINITFPQASNNIQVTNGSCQFVPSAPIAVKAVSEIDLPNGQKYIFTYGGMWGRLTQITFPDGGTISYSWGVNPQSQFSVISWQNTHYTSGGPSCYAFFDTPAITDRYVSFDGKNTALHQHFSYTTTWQNPPNSESWDFIWASKQTQVTTTDEISSLTSTTQYTYGKVGPYGGLAYGVVPVESSVVTKDSAGNVLQTANKAWADIYTMVGTQTILDNGLASTTLICPDQYERIVTKYEFAFQSTPGAATSQPSCPYLNNYSPGSNLAFGLNANVIGPLTRQTSYVYSASLTSENLLDKPTSVTLYDGDNHQVAQTLFGYDEAAVAPSGAKTNLVASPLPSRGNLTSVSRWLDSPSSFVKKTFTYFDTGNMQSSTDGCGNTTCPDMTGNFHTTYYTYLDNPNGGNSSGDTEAFQTAISFPTTVGGVTLSKSASWNYTNSTLVSSTDQNGNQTTYAYNDPLLRITDVYGPPSKQNNNTRPHTHFTYVDTVNGSGGAVSTFSSVTSTSPTGVITATYFDGMRQALQSQLQTDPCGPVYKDITYTGLGQTYSISNPYRPSDTCQTNSLTGITTYSYDALGRKVKEMYPDFNSQMWQYSGNTVTHTDEAGNQWMNTSDALGRLTNVLELGSAGNPQNLSTNYTYDTRDNLLTVNQLGNPLTTANQQGSPNTRVYELGNSSSGDQPRVRWFTYDSLSRLLTSNNPETGMICYGLWNNVSATCNPGYDANGNLQYKTDANNTIITYTYDVLNRKVSRIASDGSSTAFYDYDGINQDAPATNPSSLQSANAIGRLSLVTNSGHVGEVYSYDEMGMIVTQSTQIPGVVLWNTVTSAAYDLSGNMTSLTYPDGRQISQSFDGAGRLSTVTSGSLSYISGGSGRGIAYTAAGAEATSTLGNGVMQANTYNNRGQICWILADTPALPLAAYFQVNLMNRQYYYGPNNANNCGNQVGNNGNLQSIIDNRNGWADQGFGYDSLNRLVYAGRADGKYAFIYNYDSFGNMVAVANQTPMFSSVEYAIDPATNRLARTHNGGVSYPDYLYDNAGNLRQSGDGITPPTTYQYNAQNQLTTINSGLLASYTYDALDQRVAKQVAAVWTDYIYFDGQPIAELNQKGSWTDYIYAGGRKIAKVDATDAPLHISGTNCSNCGGTASYVMLSAGAGHVIQSGDVLFVTQYNVGNAVGGLILQFSDGSQTSGLVAQDQNGQQINCDLTQDVFHYRRMNLSAYAGKTLASTLAINDVCSPAGHFDEFFNDIAIFGADGTVTTIYSPQLGAVYSMVDSSAWPGPVTDMRAVAESNAFATPGSEVQKGTHYYLYDHLGTPQFEIAGTGWPVWHGEFAPFGTEIDNQVTDMHYKFTGKERDTESGLDHFQFRGYAPLMGRWTSPDPGWFLAVDLSNPQTFNQYSYVLNNPVDFVDPLGLDGALPAATCNSVLSCIGGFFKQLFGGGGGQSGASGSGGGGSGGSAPLPGVVLQPVMSRVEHNGKALHNIWRLTDMKGGRVNGQYGIYEDVGGNVLGCQHLPNHHCQTPVDGYIAEYNTFDDAQELSGFSDPSVSQSFNAVLAGTDKHVPVLIKIGKAYYNVLAIHYHGNNHHPTVNDLPDILPVVPDPYPHDTGYGCYFTKKGPPC